MPHVMVTIGGRAYRMACDEGQEAHLEGLGRLVDARVAELRGSFGEIGDMRLAVMASIMLVDELGEAQRRVAALERQVDEMSRTHAAEVAGVEAVEADLAAAIDEAAQRIEHWAEALHGTLAGSGTGGGNTDGRNPDASAQEASGQEGPAKAPVPGAPELDAAEPGRGEPERPA